MRDFKDVIQGRSVYDPRPGPAGKQRDDRICAHLFIAQLAPLLLRRLRHHLREKRVRLSPSDGLPAVKSIGVAELDLKGRKEVLVSRPKPHARQVLTALGINDLKPPGSTRHNNPGPTPQEAPGMTN